MLRVPVVVLLITLASSVSAQTARGLRGALEGEERGQTAPWIDRLSPPKLEGNRAEQSLRDTDLAQTAREMADRPQDVTADDLEALLKAARSRAGLWYAGPEIRDALRAIAERGDPALREEAAKAAREIDLDAHMVDLRRTVFQMMKDGKRGVEMWSEVTRKSVDYHVDRTDITDAQKYDEVMADVAAVFNGPEVRHLRTYQNTLGRLPGADPNLPNMIRVLDKRNKNMGFVGGGIDPAATTDFRPAFRDGTSNQIFHTNFFNLLGYSAAKHDPKLVNLVNFKHETMDGGGSVPDWTASEVGSQVGNFFRKLRDDGHGKRGLRALPALTGAAFSDHPMDFARPWGDEGPNYTNAVRAMDQATRKVARNPRGKFQSNYQRGWIRLLNWDFR